MDRSIDPEVQFRIWKEKYCLVYERSDVVHRKLYLELSSTYRTILRYTVTSYLTKHCYVCAGCLQANLVKGRT